MMNRRQSVRLGGLGVLYSWLFQIQAPEAWAAPQRQKRSKVPPRGNVRAHARPGHKVRALPGGHTRVVVRGGTYYYHAGAFYRRSGPEYVVVRAPIGARVRSLPAGYIRFTIGSRRYFFVNDIYFLWDDRSREYIVVDEPQGASDGIATATESVTSNIYVYPNEGQSEEEIRMDRYDCHVWAVDETGFDPSLPNQDVSLRSDYDRALAACLEGRGYTVK